MPINSLTVNKLTAFLRFIESIKCLSVEKNFKFQQTKIKEDSLNLEVKSKKTNEKKSEIFQNKTKKTLSKF
jgi:hypothetical protein